MKIDAAAGAAAPEHGVIVVPRYRAIAGAHNLPARCCDPKIRTGAEPNWCTEGEGVEVGAGDGSVGRTRSKPDERRSEKEGAESISQPGVGLESGRLVISARAFEVGRTCSAQLIDDGDGQRTLINRLTNRVTLG